MYERRKITRARYVQQYETYVLMGCRRSAANALEQVGLDRRAAVDGAEHAKKRSDSPKRAPAPRLTDRAGLRARRPCDSWHMTARQTVVQNRRVSILVVIDHSGQTTACRSYSLTVVIAGPEIRKTTSGCCRCRARPRRPNTYGPSDERHARFSPDGRRIVY